MHEPLLSLCQTDVARLGSLIYLFDHVIILTGLTFDGGVKTPITVIVELNRNP
jgi:hypothetical protein